MTAAQFASQLSDGATAVTAGLITAGLLCNDPCPRLVQGEVVSAIARQALGPEWADLCARRVTRTLAGKGWLRGSDEPQARAIARQALERTLRPAPS